jgi:VRR-NUC domain
MKAQSEAAFQQQVIQLSKYYNWISYHTHDSRRSAPGFPDLVLVRPPEILFVELKAEKGRVRPEQQEWITALHACGLEVHLWRPSDFDVLHERLARGRNRVEPLYRPPEAA